MPKFVFRVVENVLITKDVTITAADQEEAEERLYDLDFDKEHIISESQEDFYVMSVKEKSK